MERSLRFQARREVLHQMAPQYREASTSQKQTLLEAFIATTGYVPKYARWLLNHAEEVQPTHGRSQLVFVNDKRGHFRIKIGATVPGSHAPDNQKREPVDNENGEAPGGC